MLISNNFETVLLAVIDPAGYEAERFNRAGRVTQTDTDKMSGDAVCGETFAERDMKNVEYLILNLSWV